MKIHGLIFKSEIARQWMYTPEVSLVVELSHYRGHVYKKEPRIVGIKYAKLHQLVVV